MRNFLLPQITQIFADHLCVHLSNLWQKIEFKSETSQFELRLAGSTLLSAVLNF
jgi:hypothetical protein